MDNSITVTFHSWARLWVAHLTFQVPSNCRAVCTTIERFRVCAVSCPYLITTSASHWTRRPLTPFIITSWNCKMKKKLRFGSLCILGSIQVNVYKLKPWYFFFLERPGFPKTTWPIPNNKFDVKNVRKSVQSIAQLIKCYGYEAGRGRLPCWTFFIYIIAYLERDTWGQVFHQLEL